MMFHSHDMRQLQRRADALCVGFYTHTERRKLPPDAVCAQCPRTLSDSGQFVTPLRERTCVVKPLAVVNGAATHRQFFFVKVDLFSHPMSPISSLFFILQCMGLYPFASLSFSLARMFPPFLWNRLSVSSSFLLPPKSRLVAVVAPARSLGFALSLSLGSFFRSARDLLRLARLWKKKKKAKANSALSGSRGSLSLSSSLYGMAERGPLSVVCCLAKGDQK